MKITDVKNSLIAKKYANALFEMAKETNCVQKANEDLVFVVETITTNDELKKFIYSPLIKKEDKKDVLERLFSMHIDKVCLDFLKMLADSSRIDVIEEILNQFTKVFDEENNIVKPIITSAIELNEEQKQNIVSKLQNKLSKNIQPEYVINPNIIGGLVIDIDDRTMDFSLKSKFDNMHKQLTKGNRYGNN